MPLPAKRRGLPRWAIAAAAAVVVLGGGAWVAFGLLADPEPLAEVEPLPVPEPTPELPPEVTGEPEQAPAVEVDGAKLDELLEQGRQAFESNDFAAAVIAFGVVGLMTQ